MKLLLVVRGRGLKRNQGLPGTGGTSSVRAGELGRNVVRVSKRGEIATSEEPVGSLCLGKKRVYIYNTDLPCE